MNNTIDHGFKSEMDLHRAPELANNTHSQASSFDVIQDPVRVGLIDSVEKLYGSSSRNISQGHTTVTKSRLNNLSSLGSKNRPSFSLKQKQPTTKSQLAIARLSNP